MSKTNCPHCGMWNPGLTAYCSVCGAELPQATRANFPRALRSLKKLKILNRLGEDHWGEVFEALERESDRRLLVRLLPEELFGAERNQLARIREESVAATEVSLPGCCPVLEVGDAEGHIYLLSAHPGGKPIHQILEEKVPSLRRSLQLLVRIGESICELHEMGRVHGALTALNMMETANGKVLFSDVGLKAASLRSEDQKEDLLSLGRVAQALLGDAPGNSIRTAKDKRENEVEREFESFTRRLIDQDCRSGFGSCSEALAELRRLKESAGSGWFRFWSRRS